MVLCRKNGWLFVRVVESGRVLVQSRCFATPEEAAEWCRAYLAASR